MEKDDSSLSWKKLISHRALAGGFCAAPTSADNSRIAWERSIIGSGSRRLGHNSRRERQLSPVCSLEGRLVERGGRDQSADLLSYRREQIHLVAAMRMDWAMLQIDHA